MTVEAVKYFESVNVENIEEKVFLLMKAKRESFGQLRSIFLGRCSYIVVKAIVWKYDCTTFQLARLALAGFIVFDRNLRWIPSKK